MWSQENGFPHARVIYFRLCAIYAQAGCFVWCAWLLLSKVNLNWKKFSYFDPHDYHVMIIYKPVTSCIYISVGCLMTPSLVWLMSPWLTGILIDHRTLIMHFTCSLQNVGQADPSHGTAIKTFRKAEDQKSKLPHKLWEKKVLNPLL